MDRLAQEFKPAESPSITRADLPLLSVAEVAAQASAEDKFNLIANALKRPLDKLSLISPEAIANRPMPHQDWRWPEASVVVSQNTGERFHYEPGLGCVTRCLETEDQDGRLQTYRLAEQLIDPASSGQTAQPAHRIVEQTYLYAPQTSERLLLAAVVASYKSAKDPGERENFSQGLDIYWFEPVHSIASGYRQYQSDDFIKHSSERLSAHCLNGWMWQIDYYQQASPQADQPLVYDGRFPGTKVGKMISAYLENGQSLKASIIERDSPDRDNVNLEGVALERDYCYRAKEVNHLLLADKFTWLADSPAVNS